jgi:putative ABC transport system ATP-binding protein
MTNPEVLFADEPTGNLDQKTAQKVVELLFELNAKHGTTLVLVTHDLALADKCDRVLLMNSGTLKEATDDQ